jgi:hypothetical protein
MSKSIIDEILRVTSYKRLQNKYQKIRERRLEFVDLISKQSIWSEACGDDLAHPGESRTENHRFAQRTHGANGRS